MTNIEKKILKVTVDLIKEGNHVTGYKVAKLAGVERASVYHLYKKISNLQLKEI
ncbi:MAG: hypothetical protein RBS26_05925 [Sulfuricurvum sp.]|jgi:hypothetical protein|nr:hypothetical protein [Sulfuricurvum sp.]